MSGLFNGLEIAFSVYDGRVGGVVGDGTDENLVPDNLDAAIASAHRDPRRKVGAGTLARKAMLVGPRQSAPFAVHPGDPFQRLAIKT